MKTIDFWFDPISPFAYLAFERLPMALQGLSYDVRYRPLLFAGLLKQWGQKGPAEIEPKRAWTFRLVAWTAHQHGIPMQTPEVHPFNPLALLRLLVASTEDDSSTPSRRACELVFRHVWRGGLDANDPERLQSLTAAIAPKRDPQGEVVKTEVRAATDAAIAQGVFGVPTFVVDGRAFWGGEALPMLRAVIAGDPWFDGPGWTDAAAAPPGVARRS